MNSSLTNDPAAESGGAVSLVHRSDAAYEFALTSALLFAVVTVIRWVFGSGSPVAISNPRLGLLVIGVLVGVVILALIHSPWGKRSGAHLNPAVTVALWLMGVFPARGVPFYVAAQLAGAVAGTALGRLVWGPSVAAVRYGAVSPTATWNGAEVFMAEAGCLAAITLLAGFFVAHPAQARHLPLAVAVSVAATIALLGPVSGGSANPARQFGPALLAGDGRDLWIYLTAPVAGAAIGASVHHLLMRRRRSSSTAEVLP